MKNIYKTYTLLLSLLFFASFSLAAPGDTTWVQANDVQLDYYNNFDQEVVFPDETKTYRKILMYFDLGKYNCPSGEQYCHQWDYTVLNYILTETDTVEISRLITPFATAGWARFAGNWKKSYVFDVTDYERILHGDSKVRIHYSGYSGGFTADVKFAFIEGTPDRNVIGMETVYDGSFQYGNTSNPINSQFDLKSFTTPVGTKDAAMKVLITGHGSDNNQCCEFRSSNYQLELNGSQIANYTIWKDDCGKNNLYPQGGTWIYDRANWCPGEQVAPVKHKLSGVDDEGVDYTVRMKFNNYTGSGNLGSYSTSATIFYYGDFNKATDLSLEKIITPTNADDEYRNNPGGTQPEILVKNTGSNAITSVKFQYGVKDSTVQEYLWTGNIPALEERRIVMDELTALKNLTLSEFNGQAGFFVEIIKVNGAVDEDATNNKLKSTFTVAPVLPGDLVIDFKPSNIGANGVLNTFPADASWEIFDQNGNVVHSRVNNTGTTQYLDTISFDEVGVYKLKITTLGCGGLSWWAYSQGWGGYQPGSFKLKKATGSTIIMDGYKYTGTGRHDFGCEFEYYFSVAEPGTLALEELKINNDDIKVYPNPAKNDINIEINPNAKIKNVSLVNELGEVIYKSEIGGPNLVISTSKISSGVYTLLFDNSGQQIAKKVIVTK